MAEGQSIQFSNGKIQVPNNPIIPFIEGDGTGPDIWKASSRIIDAAVNKAYKGQKKIEWMEIYAGEKAFNKFNNWLPEDTLTAMKKYIVSIKGPLTTPVGGGMRSLNVAIRQMLDLYVCLRPVKYFKGVPSPVRDPASVDMTIFRENTEDIYAGIEFESGTADVKKVLSFLKETFPKQYDKIRFPETTAIGFKPVSKEGSERLIRAAVEYCFINKRNIFTLVHKGNIMKFTEGGFRSWGYDLIKKEYAGKVFTSPDWDEIKKAKGEEAANAAQAEAKAAGKLIVNDVIADIAFQQVLTRPKEFQVMATMNLNGDYLSDALAAQVGGIGIAPGGNINYKTGHAVFEATHGTAPKYANQDKVNPGSVTLSGEMLLRHLGWMEAADLIIKGLDGAIGARTVTYDFARLMKTDGGGSVKEVKCSEFADAVISKM